MTKITSSSDWISVADLEKGFEPESFVLDHSADLGGQRIELHDDNNNVRTLTIAQGQLQVDDGPAIDVRITSLRKGIYLLDWLDESIRPTTSYSLILDTLSESYTQVVGTMPSFAVINVGLYERALTGRPLTDVKVSFSHGSVNRPYVEGTCPHAPTNELVGKRMLYRYSPTEVYEHTYLNTKLYTWQCLKGVEQGLGDTDACYYYKIADQLYLFVWCEKIVPTLGLVMVDRLSHRSDGKIFGVGDTEDAPLSNFPVASYCQCLSVTEYPDDL